jgi:hypothetical protein
VVVVARKEDSEEEEEEATFLGIDLSRIRGFFFFPDAGNHSNCQKRRTQEFRVLDIFGVCISSFA